MKESKRTAKEKFGYLVQDRLTSSDCLGVIALCEGGVICSAFKLSCSILAPGQQRKLTLLTYKPREAKKKQEMFEIVVATLTSAQFDCEHPVKISFSEWSVTMERSPPELGDLIMKVFVNAILEYCRRLLCKQLVDTKNLATIALLNLEQKTVQVTFVGGRVQYFVHVTLRFT